MSDKYAAGDRRLVSGAGALGSLREHLASVGVTRPVLIGGVKTVAAFRALLPPDRMPAFVGDYVAPLDHAPDTVVDDVVAVIAAAAGDGIVTVGGGSAAEVGKAARHSLRDSTPLLGHVAVSTTASQAEYTTLTGVTLAGEKHKSALRCAPPEVVLADGELIMSTPARLWFGTVGKAFDTTLSGYLSIPEIGAVSHELLHTLRSLWDHLGVVGTELDTPTDRLRAHSGAWMGKIVTQGFRGHSTARMVPWLGHAARHQIGALTGAQHGEISSVLLGPSLRFYAEFDPQRVPALIEHLPVSALTELQEVARTRAASHGLPGSLGELGVKPDMVAGITESIIAEEGYFAERRADVHSCLEMAL